MATTLKHDAQGFLIGELLDGNRDLLRGQEASLQIWRAVQYDVRAIVKSLGVERAPTFAQPAGRSTSPKIAANAPTFERAARAPSAQAAGASVVSPVGRDVRGRFTAKASAALDRPAAPPGAAGATARLTNAVGRLSASLQATDNLDPSINAAKEVTDVVAPLGRGLATMFGRGEKAKKERWYNRFWKALTAKREDKVIVAGGGGGGGGLFSGLGGKGGLPGVPGAGGLLGGLMRRGGGLLKGGGRLLRRIPLLGALLAGGGAIASMLGIDDDDSKTPEENRAQRYRGTGEAVGMGVGGVLGGLLGSLLGPAGTVAGALVGSIVGEKVGGAVGAWTKGLIDSDIGGKIIEGWNVVTAGVSAAWESLTTDVKTAWGTITTKAGEWWDKTSEVAKTLSDKVGELASGMNDWFKGKTGIDIAQTASDAVTSVKSTAGTAWSAAKGYAAEAGAAVADAAGRAGAALIPNTVKRAYTAGSAAATQAKAGYDEARGKPTTVPAPANALQTGARSAGNMAGGGINRIVETGAGYNVVQKADGSVVRQDGARNWRNNNPGNIEAGKFASSMGAIGSDGRFAIFPSYEAGRAAKAKLIFEGDQGRALSTAGDYGKRLGYKDKTLKQAIAAYAPQEENNTATYQAAVLASVGGANKKMRGYTPAEREAIMDAMQKVEGYRAGKTTTVSAVASSAARVAPVNGPSVPTGVSANVPSSVPPNIPPIPAETASTTVNSGAGAGRGTVGVTIKNEVSQNVPDRGVAHVATGGIGGA